MEWLQIQGHLLGTPAQLSKSHIPAQYLLLETAAFSCLMVGPAPSSIVICSSLRSDSTYHLAMLHECIIAIQGQSEMRCLELYEKQQRGHSLKEMSYGVISWSAFLSQGQMK